MAPRQATNRTFLSYSHESPQHRARTHLLYKLLREHGVDARGDFTAQPRDWAAWTDDEISQADRILVVASPGYRQQTRATSGGESGRGVRYEWQYIQSAIYVDDEQNTDKVICVLMPGMDLSEVPAPLDAASRNHCRIDLSPDGIKGLLGRIYGRPDYPEIPLGPRLDLPEPAGSIMATFRIVIEGPNGHVDPAITSTVVRDACRSADVSCFDLGLDVDEGRGVVPLLPEDDVLGRWIRGLRERIDAQPPSIPIRIRIGLALTTVEDLSRAVDLAFGETARAMHGVAHGEFVVVRSAAFQAAVEAEITRFPPRDAYRETTRDRLGGPSCWVAVAGLPDCPTTPPPITASTATGPRRQRTGGRWPSGDQYRVAIRLGSRSDDIGAPE